MESLPLRRDEELVVTEVEDETLVYDKRTHKAFCLNQTSSLVWQYCDGTKTPTEIAEALALELNKPVTEDVVLLALQILSDADLLARHKVRFIDIKITRRELLRRTGLIGAAVAIPTVISILAPTAANAMTCVNSCAGQPNGTPCRILSVCVGTCTNGICT